MNTRDFNKLTNLEISFCEQYVIDRNHLAAFERAGYRAKNKTYAYRKSRLLLERPAIAAYIAKLDEEIRERNKITKDTIIADIIEIRDRCLQRIPVMDFDHVTKEFVQRTNEDGLGVWTFDANNALKACDMLAKHIGFYEADKEKNNVNILNVQPTVNDLLKLKLLLDNE